MALGLLAKQQGETSFDALKRLKRLVYEGERLTMGVQAHSFTEDAGSNVPQSVKAKAPRLPELKLGHSGTLDPRATGLLVVAEGEGTKLLPLLTGLDKTYEAEFYFGLSSQMLDLDGALEWPKEPCSAPNVEKANAQILDWVGKEQLQVPPGYSAIKVRGESAHARVRRGETVELKARPFRILQASTPLWGTATVDGKTVWTLRLSLRVTSGTYIRALARDWGLLWTGYPGLLASLHRVSVGPWDMRMLGDKSYLWMSDSELEAAESSGLWTKKVVPAELLQPLQSYGRWSAESWGPYLFPSNSNGFAVEAQAAKEPVAWFVGENLQRVFLKDPFQWPFSKA